MFKFPRAQAVTPVENQSNTDEAHQIQIHDMKICPDLHLPPLFPWHVRRKTLLAVDLFEELRAEICRHI